MAHWIRYQHNGTIGFGTLDAGRIDVHAGDLFAQAGATGADDDIFSACVSHERAPSY